VEKKPGSIGCFCYGMLRCDEKELSTTGLKARKEEKQMKTRDVLIIMVFSFLCISLVSCCECLQYLSVCPSGKDEPEYSNFTTEDHCIYADAKGVCWSCDPITIKYGFTYCHTSKGAPCSDCNDKCLECKVATFESDCSDYTGSPVECATRDCTYTRVS